MEEALVYWILKKFGKSRGYILPASEWKKLIPYSEKEMVKKYLEWQKELKQVAGEKVRQTD